jgi:hypothetical protein
MNKRALYEANMNLQLEDLKKSASIAWDELDKSHAARAKLHYELMIAEGQRDQWKMKYEDWYQKALSLESALRGEQGIYFVDDDTHVNVANLRAERDALLTVYEAAEDFIGAQGTAYEDDQYRMLCGVLGAYNQQRGIHES